MIKSTGSPCGLPHGATQKQLDELHICCTAKEED